MSEPRKPLRLITGAELIQALKRQGRGPDGVPLSLNAPGKELERAAYLKSQEPIMPENTPAPSPTGTPLLHPKVAAVAFVIVALAGVMMVFNFAPETDIDEKIAGAIIAFGGMIGIASPGIRK